MMETWLVLIPILVTDVVNPVLFAFMVYAAGSDRPVINSSLILLGHTLAYFSAGIVLALGFDRVAHRLSNPQFIDYLIGLILGVLLLWVAVRSRGQADSQQTTQTGKLTVLKALGTGAIVNFVGIPFALPYFAAIDQILKADLSAVQATSMLIAYNVLYALPFAVVPVLLAIYGDQSRELLQRINAVLNRAAGYLMPVLLAAVGIALVVDAIRYMVTGKGLI